MCDLVSWCRVAAVRVCVSSGMATKTGLFVVVVVVDSLKANIRNQGGEWVSSMRGRTRKGKGFGKGSGCSPICLLHSCYKQTSSPPHRLRRVPKRPQPTTAISAGPASPHSLFCSFWLPGQLRHHTSLRPTRGFKNSLDTLVTVGHSIDRPW